MNNIKVMTQALDALLNAVPCTEQQMEDQSNAIEALQAAIVQPVPPAQGKRQPQWLPIADAPGDTEVLVSGPSEWDAKTFTRDVATFCKGQWEGSSRGLPWEPTHWMPLPLPPTATPQGKL